MSLRILIAEPIEKIKAEGRIQLFILMYPINSLEYSGRIVIVVSESKTGIVPSRQNYIPQDDQSYTKIV